MSNILIKYLESHLNKKVNIDYFYKDRLDEDFLYAGNIKYDAFRISPGINTKWRDVTRVEFLFKSSVVSVLDVFPGKGTEKNLYSWDYEKKSGFINIKKSTDFVSVPFRVVKNDHRECETCDIEKQSDICHYLMGINGWCDEEKIHYLLDFDE